MGVGKESTRKAAKRSERKERQEERRKQQINAARVSRGWGREWHSKRERRKWRPCWKSGSDFVFFSFGSVSVSLNNQTSWKTFFTLLLPAQPGKSEFATTGARRSGRRTASRPKLCQGRRARPSTRRIASLRILQTGRRTKPDTRRIVKPEGNSRSSSRSTSSSSCSSSSSSSSSSLTFSARQEVFTDNFCWRVISWAELGSTRCRTWARSSFEVRANRAVSDSPILDGWFLRWTRPDLRLWPRGAVS